MKIEDGHGTGSKVQVNTEGCLCTKAVTIPFGQHINSEYQETYSIIINKTPTGADDCFLYVKNNSDKDLFVCSLMASADTDETIQIKIKDIGTPVGGSTNTPVNRNAGSGKVADITCLDGVDITGLSGGSIVEQFVFDGNAGSEKFRYNSCIIIPKNHVLTLYAVTGAIALKVSLSLIFHD